MSDIEEEQKQNEDSENDEEKLEELIESVKKRKLLYDPSSVSNRNTFLKEQAWGQISAEIQKSNLWCRTEWSKLRSAYSKKKKALIGKTGQKRKKIEAWSYFLPMQFLDDFPVVARTSGNLASDSSGIEQTNDGKLADNIEANEGSQNQASAGPSHMLITGRPKAVGNSDADKGPCVTYSSRRHLKHETDKVDTEIMNYLGEKRAKLDKKIEFDENHHFALSVAGRLRKMNEQTASYTKMRIMQILHDAEYPATVIEFEADAN